MAETRGRNKDLGSNRYTQVYEKDRTGINIHTEDRIKNFLELVF